MNILQVLEKLAGGAGGLILLLEQVAAKAPDLAPEAREWIDNLGAAVSQENLVALAAALPAEIAAIAGGKLDPHDHPSDAI